VPSFEQFKQIKDKIVRNNSNLAKSSMLKLNDDADKTLEEYTKLEAIA
jgi:hypothetical protein